jgi:nucleoside-specific outer membrane channel protein Tsx
VAFNHTQEFLTMKRIHTPAPHRRLPALALSLAIGGLGAAPAQAGSASFATTNIQYLYGTQYELGDDTRSIVTIEHANAWKYGDNFLFVDITNPDRDGKLTKTGHYAEISPRLSLGKISGLDLSVGPIQDLLISTTVELPDSPASRRYLYGMAADLAVPGFRFFKLNWYVRNSDAPGVDTGQQLTLAWNAPFTLGGLDFAFEGFADYAWGEDPLEDNLLTAPRLLLDVAALLGAKPGQLQTGVEYQIWRNKFGIDGVDEDVAQAMVKWIW